MKYGIKEVAGQFHVVDDGLCYSIEDTREEARAALRQLAVNANNRVGNIRDELEEAAERAEALRLAYEEEVER